MDKEWNKFPRFSQEYINGVTQFLDFSYTNGRPQEDEHLCPCAKCKKLYWKTRDNIKDHLIAKCFLKGYDIWLHHGSNYKDREKAHGVHEGPNDDARKFYNLIKEAEQELYPG
ncbi:unnamed protein product [Vicia faba]|uniref:Transposase-associated domain-containing protein n=1 Tax=Vicia faba TaxID=3906 RepID=A0AAV1AH78_VICFA|nr:unnamed protein product [Vicia faba]